MQLSDLMSSYLQDNSSHAPTSLGFQRLQTAVTAPTGCASRWLSGPIDFLRFLSAYPDSSTSYPPTVAAMGPGGRLPSFVGTHSGNPSPSPAPSAPSHIQRAMYWQVVAENDADSALWNPAEGPCALK